MISLQKFIAGPEKVYGLRDKGGEIFYVGMTSRGWNTTLYELLKIVDAGSMTPVHRHVREVGIGEIEIELLEVIGSHPPYGHANARKRAHVAMYENLLNVDRKQKKHPSA